MTPTRRCARATTNRGTDDRPIDSRAFASRRENNLREASLDGGVREEVFACVRRARARASERARATRRRMRFEGRRGGGVRCVCGFDFFCFRVVGTGRARVGVFETPRDEGDARLTSGF